MPIYFRAYSVRQLREFPGWPEEAPPCQDSIAFLGADLTVRADPVPDGEMLFADDSEEWAAFCRGRLEFAVPNWDEESVRVHAALDAKGL